MMSRRSAVKRTAAAVAAASLAHRIQAADDASGLKGRIHHSACRWCYGKIPMDDFLKAAKEIGLAAIDLLTVEEIPAAQKYGLTCAIVTGVPGGITQGLNRLENHDKIVEFFEKTAPRVAELGCKNMIVFSGNRGGMSDEEGIKNCATGIKRLLPVLEKHKLVAVMELLNSKVNHADYMCDRTPWGVELCKAVGSENFKLLYDIYHMQIMEGDVIATIKAHHSFLAHYHTGGVPGRNEIDESQELYYPAIMKAIVETGYQGFVAQEFIPKRDPLASLKQCVGICDV